MAKKKINEPDAAIELLIVIAEGGRPRDSLTAFACALALVDNPAMPAPAIRLFKVDLGRDGQRLGRYSKTALDDKAERMDRKNQN